jgi:LuxR family maltose regulon positive regulatory protein
LTDTVAILDRILPQAESSGRRAHAIKIYLLKALANQKQGEPTAAIENLESSLSLAAAEGYCRTFVEHGEPVARLLREAATRGIMPDYAGRLLATFASGEKGDVSPPYHPLVVEPLSPRELEVLQLLADGLSNREISARLFLALDTVKGHNYRIYRKLQVQRRTEAVARARDLGLL